MTVQTRFIASSPLSRLRIPALAAILLLGLAPVGCGNGNDTESAVPTVPVAGLYRVSGTTMDADTGANEREITGTIVIRTEGERYTATFELSTPFPGLGVEHTAAVIGKGEGSVTGRDLDGTADTQIVTSVVPGVDAGFAFIPRSLSTRRLR